MSPVLIKNPCLEDGAMELIVDVYSVSVWKPINSLCKFPLPKDAISRIFDATDFKTYQCVVVGAAKCCDDVDLERRSN